MKLYLPVVLGTAREGRESEKAAKFVLGEVQKNPEVETELVDVRDYNIPATDNSEESATAKKWAEKMDRADGLIVVSPEYNHGYPGELKMFLDMIYGQYARKPVTICGVSAGGLGGARMVEQLRLVFVELHMAPIREAVYFANIGKLFDAAGNIQDPSYAARVDKMTNELIWYAKALQSARMAGA